MISLGRLECDAALLWRDHPPRVSHAQKRKLLDLVGGLARTPSGTVTITRWAPTPEGPWLVGGQAPQVSVTGPFTYPEPEPGTTDWHVNFADTELFAFYGGSAFAQDEIQVAEHPLLASVRGLLLSNESASMPALTRERERPTPVLVRNVERWGAIDVNPPLAEPYGIYGRRLSRASDEMLHQAVTRLEGNSRSNVIAMVAPQGNGDYSADDIRDVLVTAATGFAAARAESPAAARLCVHTGHWGTGAFGGDRVLMAAAQVLAARVVQVDVLRYYSLDSGGEQDFAEGASIANSVAEGVSIDEVVAHLEARGFRWGSSDGN